MVEVAAAGVVSRVAAPPKIIWRERQETAGVAEDVVRAAIAQERMVPAVVLDDEDADQHPGRRQRQGEREPIGPERAQVHQVPEDTERHDRIDDLPAALERVGKLVLG